MMDRATIAVHAGRAAPQPGAPLNPPVTLASTYHAGTDVGYGRVDNDTWQAFEAALGALEGGTARAFGSGMAAMAAVLDGLGEHGVVVAPGDAYTGTRFLLADLAERRRIALRLVDVADTPATLAACDGADLLWIESPTNPQLSVADIRALAAGAHARGAAVVVDNTFATPLLQRPLALGADVVVHSATKFLAGHSDVILGAAVTGDAGRAAALHQRRTLTGAIPGPFEAWLALRGLRTLPVRLERAQATAAQLARRLATHARVQRVRYPGLPDDPGHSRAAGQMDGFGAIVAFEVPGGEAAERVCAAVRLIAHATSLGGVETTMERRARLPGEVAPAGLIRLSVGLEAEADLWEDLAGALERA